jgi:putative phage-type endonuclease
MAQISRNVFATHVYNQITSYAKTFLQSTTFLANRNLLPIESPLNHHKKPLSNIIEALQTFLSDDVELLVYLDHYSVPKKDYHPDYIAMILLHNFENQITNDCDYRFHTKLLNEYNLTQNVAQLEYLKTLPTQIQGTPEWMAARKEGLTACNIKKVLYGSIKEKVEIVLDKCKTDDVYKKIYSPAMQHGHQHEDNGIAIFESRSNRDVFEFGCMQHQEFSFLKASPDGIDNMGEMLEIKMPYSRIPHEIPKPDYYNQMQLQLEVCDLDVCNFLECVVKHYTSKADYLADINKKARTGPPRHCFTGRGLEKGVMLEGKSRDNLYFNYKYAPLDLMPDEIDEWLNENTEELNVEAKEKQEEDNVVYNDFVVRPVYWYLVRYSCIKVYRDSNWISKNIGKFHTFWRTVLYYRKHGIEPLLEFLETGNNNCLPKHPGIVNFPDFKVRKSTRRTKVANIFSKNTCLLMDSSDEEDELNKTNNKVSNKITKSNSVKKSTTKPKVKKSSKKKTSPKTTKSTKGARITKSASGKLLKFSSKPKPVKSQGCLINDSSDEDLSFM